MHFAQVGPPGQPNGEHSGGSGNPFDGGPYDGGAFTFGDDSTAQQELSSAGGGGGAARKRRGSRAAGTPQNAEQEAKLRRQQMLNKAAQQRYRQRRKERQQTIEVTLMQMQEANSQLQAQVLALEAALMAAKVSIHDNQDPASLSPGGQAPSGSPGSGNFAPGGAAGGRGAGAHYRARVAAVQAFVREQRVREAHASGQPLPPEAAAELRDLVTACAASCIGAIDVTSPEALWPLSPPSTEAAGEGIGGGGGGGGGAAGRAADKQRWLQVLADVSLSDDQMRDLLALRAQLLEALGRCLSDRRALAERVLTAPRAALDPLGGEGAPSSVLQQGGYCDGVAHASLAARAALMQMQARARGRGRGRTGIAAEGRAVREFTGRVLTGVLTPEQAAVLVDRAPTPADVLNLANALNELCGMVPQLGAICNPAAAGGAGAAPTAAGAPAMPAAAIVAAAAAAASAAMLRSGPQHPGPGAAPAASASAGGSFSQRVPSANSLGQSQPTSGRASVQGSGRLSGELAAHAPGDPQQELQLQLQRQAAAVAQLQLQRQAAAAAQQQVQLQLQRQAHMWAAQQHQLQQLHGIKDEALEAQQQQQQREQQQKKQRQEEEEQQQQAQQQREQAEAAAAAAATAAAAAPAGGLGQTEHRDLQMFMHRLMSAEASPRRRSAADGVAGGAGAGAGAGAAAGAGPEGLPSLPGSLRATGGGGGAGGSMLASAAMDALPGDVLMADDDLLSSLDYLLGDGAGI
ncbi:hypothetical protein Rsub_02925 [Raphidocelis subcapitata]|uniref:BZIP domain-containing protein n=1 Tax=Raphidocelis subcapitata TaxID=307507 RepID=A0A2V0NY48_9CHLO|nr:hypothetical protein Rsub_02925 [Raphidocelis subcapitata]|eukprot:GBF89755.1 hypothetical protein Rsub_02925 [Raphidocelis subcapitata]